MSAQVSDYIKKDRELFQIAEKTDWHFFDPKVLGIEPKCCCTAVGRGFWCGYSWDEKRVWLDELNIHSEGECYPPINGINPEPEVYIELKNDSERNFRYAPNRGHRKYVGLHIPIDFTGKLLLGTNRVKHWVNYGGNDCYWKYKKLLSVTIEKGLIISQEDVSDFGRYVYSFVRDNWNSSDEIEFLREFHLQNTAEVFATEKPWWVLKSLKKDGI